MQYRIRLTGCSRTFTCGEGESALAGMVRLGHRGIPVGCRGGGCGVCKVQVKSGAFVSGKLSRACVTEAEQAQGYSLACRLFPRSDLELEVVGIMRRAVQDTELPATGERA